MYRIYRIDRIDNKRIVIDVVNMIIMKIEVGIIHKVIQIENNV